MLIFPLSRYSYEIKLTMEASGGILKRHADITLTLDHYFSNYTRLLRADDKIRFKGLLTNEPDTYSIGSRDFVIKGYEIDCIECKDARGDIVAPKPTVSKLSKLFRTVLSDCLVSAKYILNFLLNPVVVFK